MNRMTKLNKDMKIKIVKDGPYIVTGGVPLVEKIIEPTGNRYIYKKSKDFTESKTYSLCRCGKSKNHPFCDGEHRKVGFDGTEVASKEKYDDRAKIFEGPGVDVMDDGRCAIARFCHEEHGSVWQLVKKSDDPELKKEVIRGCVNCPTGRLVAVDKETGEKIEPELDPCIEVLQDPEKEVSGPYYVKGKIPIESVDGTIYEVRNRIGLCRCGETKDTPFCDGKHLKTGFTDEYIDEENE